MSILQLKDGDDDGNEHSYESVVIRMVNNGYVVEWDEGGISVFQDREELLEYLKDWI